MYFQLNFIAMKNIFLSIIMLVFFCSLAKAQFNTGSKMVGASSSLDFGFTSEKDEGSADASKIISINLTPRAAYFVQNRIAIGGDLGYFYYRSRYDDSDPYRTTDFLIGPFARYYCKSIAWVRPFAEVKLGGGTSVTKYYVAGELTKTKHSILYTGAGVGAAFFLAENFALEGMLDYTFEHQKNKDTDQSHNSHGIMLSFGFSFFFNSLVQE
jgi:hypothetical protein